MDSTSLSLLQRLTDKGTNGDWSRFIELYAPLILRTVVRLGIPEREAEDLVQDVMSIVVKEMREFQYEPTKSFRGWLSTITRNRCVDYFRQAGRSPRPTRIGDVDVGIPDSVEQLTIAEYRGHLVGRVLELMQSEFEEKTWKACWACVAEGRAAKDVADDLGLSVNAVYLAKSRVLRRLRHELNGLLD
ncbi:MAG: sigma-70 family RNA polymerase sigma factor [Planctomycetes bacterium]|nr:sigma-70 family RNA polymerase sigma factor [Planctomycetota bacterium]